MDKIIFSIYLSREPDNILEFCNQIDVNLSDRQIAILKYYYNIVLSDIERNLLQLHREETPNDIAGEFICIASLFFSDKILLGVILSYEIYCALLSDYSQGRLRLLVYLDKATFFSFCCNIPVVLQEHLKLFFDGISATVSGHSIYVASVFDSVRLDLLAVGDRCLMDDDVAFVAFVFDKEHLFYESEAGIYLYNLCQSNNLKRVVFFDFTQIDNFDALVNAYVDQSVLNKNILSDVRIKVASVK